MTDMNHVWATLGGDPVLLPRLSTVVRDGVSAARLPVRELARTCTGVCALAAAELGAPRPTTRASSTADADADAG